MKTNIFSSKVFISFIAVCVYFLVIYFISDFVYAGNDDRGLIFILSGHYAEPSYYTGFMSWYMSMFLEGLYSLAPSFPFMGCLFLLCMFASIWYGTWYVLSKSKSTWTSIILIVLLFIGLYRFVCKCTFTYIPAFFAIPLVLICFDLKLDNKKEFAKNLVLFSVFALLAAGIREKVFFMLIPFLLLIIVIQNIRDKTKRCTILMVPIVAVICTFGVVGDSLLVKNNPEYKNTMEYCQVRSEIMDFYGLPDYDENKAFYQSLGISKEAYQLIKDWYFDMPEASLENMTAIRDFQKEKFSISFLDAVDKIRISYKKTQQLLVVAIILAILSAYAMFRENKKFLFAIAGTVIGTIIISFFLVIFMKFPERLAICLLLFNIAFYIALITNYFVLDTQKLKYVGIYALVGVFGVAFLLNSMTYDNTKDKAYINDYRQLEQHIAADSDNVYMLDIGLYMFGEKLFNSNQKCVNLYQNGWPIWFPSYNQQIASWGETTFYDYIKNGKPLKYVASKSANPNDISFNRYVQSKLNRKFVKCEEYKDFVIYEVVLI